MSKAYSPPLQRLEGLRRLCEADIRRLNALTVQDDTVTTLTRELQGLREDIQISLEYAREEISKHENGDLGAGGSSASAIVEAAARELEDHRGVYRELAKERDAILAEYTTEDDDENDAVTE